MSEFVHEREEEGSERRVLRHLDYLIEIGEALMAAQDDINAAVAQIQADLTSEGNAIDQIKTEIANLQAQNPALDVTGLQAAVSQLDQTAATLAAIPPPPPPQ